MESHLAAADPSGAGDLLADLDADRSALVERLATPAWYLVAMAALAAVYVASPVLGEGRTALFGLVAPTCLVLATVLQRRRLVRPAGVGVTGWGIHAVHLGGLLLLLSVSFGLVAEGLHAWVVLPAVAAGALTYTTERRLDVLVRRRAARVA